MVKIGRKKNRPNALVSFASVRWRTLAEKVYCFNGHAFSFICLFSADITKTVAAKRKRLELFTQSSLKSSSRKVEDIWKIQQSER